MASNERASRQKNCNACVRSKRKCDKQLPACGRCIKKRYLCLYGGKMDIPPLGGPAEEPIHLDSFEVPNSTSGGDTFIFTAGGLSPPLEANVDMAPGTMFQIDSAFESVLGAMPGSTDFGAGSWQSGFMENQMQDAKDKTMVRGDYAKMFHICVRTPLSQSSHIFILELTSNRKSTSHGN
jgi:hypothetical protein